MTKITWLGEDTEEQPGPNYNIWNGIKFPKGQAVEVDNAHMIMKAKVHPFYKVEEQTHVEIKEGKEEQEVQIKEEGKEEYDYRQAEKGSGYTPVKKKVRKKKAPIPATDGSPDADA